MKYIDTKDGPVCPNCYHPALECRCEDSRPASCSPSIYEVMRNTIAALDPETETGAWGIEVLGGILENCPEEYS